MKDISDVLTVSFDNGLKDESALCVTRKCGEKIIMLKMELGEQADILHRLLTEQMTKAEIKTESKQETKTGHWITGRSIYYDVEMYRCSECKNWSPYKAEKCPNCHVRMLGEKE